MTDVIDHIICGGVGKFIGWKSIMIGDHGAINVAVNLKHKSMVAELMETGMNREKAIRITRRKGRQIQRFFDDLYADMADLGLDVEQYDPHDKPHD